MVEDRCDRCGKCCKAIPCSIGLALLGDHRPCKALERKEDGTYECGLVRKTSDYMPLGKECEWKDDFLRNLFSHMLGIGLGCCSSPHTDLIHSEIANRIQSFRMDK